MLSQDESLPSKSLISSGLYLRTNAEKQQYRQDAKENSIDQHSMADFGSLSGRQSSEGSTFQQSLEDPRLMDREENVLEADKGGCRVQLPLRSALQKGSLF